MFYLFKYSDDKRNKTNHALNFTYAVYLYGKNNMECQSIFMIILFGPEVKNSFHAQLSMKFVLLINLKQLQSLSC